MNRTKLLTIAVIGLLLINAGTLGVLLLRPAHHPPMEGPRGEGPKRIIIERLHFDAQQQEAYQLLIDEHRQKMRELNEASRGLHDQLFVLLKETPADTAKADNFMQQIAANQLAIEQLNFDHFNKIKALCKGSQLNDFNELVNDLGQLFQK